MRNIIATIAVLLASPAYAVDVMIANMDNGRGEKTIHTQASDDCRKVLRVFKGLQEEGKKLQLTFMSPPPYSGCVLELHCVRPDGSIIGVNGVEKLKPTMSDAPSQ